LFIFTAPVEKPVSSNGSLNDVIVGSIVPLNNRQNADIGDGEVRRDNAARSGDSIAGKQLGSNGFKNIAEQWLSGRGLIHHRHSGMRLSGKHRFPSGKFF